MRILPRQDEKDRGSRSGVGHGTGKLRGLTGKGTYKSTGNADGSQDHVEGEYTLPPPPPPKTKAKK